MKKFAKKELKIAQSAVNSTFVNEGAHFSQIIGGLFKK